MPAALLTEPVLLIDCQATGSSPVHGRLIEIGWAVSRADRPDDRTVSQKEVFQLALPAGEEIPRRVQELTGIQAPRTEDAVSEEVVWKRLQRRALDLARDSRTQRCTAVIHYARFEAAFLRQLHLRWGARRHPFPFDIVCTHQIARRLYPQLPRRGLRALAGYLGRPVTAKRRCADHLDATAVIWKAVATRLVREHNLTSMTDLFRWLEAVRSSVAARVYPLDRKQLDRLPSSPGVYLFKGLRNHLLYVGKAADLKKRVGSYFQPRRPHAEHILEMLTQVRSIDFLPTESALEAALLESDRIKRFQPPYNRALLKNGRRIYYASADFRSISTRPQTGRRWGPFPHRAPAETLKHLVAGLPPEAAVDARTALASHLASSFPGVSAECDAIHGGIALFYEHHRRRLRTPPWPTALLKLAADLWRREKRLSQTAQDPSEAEAAKRSGRSSLDGPERVADLVASALRQAGHMVRRARWLSLLSESVLVWRCGAQEGGTKHIARIHQGRLAATTCPPETELPSFYDLADPNRIRQQTEFTVARYDRLRILTTELRRLAAENRFIALYVRSDYRIGPAKLKKMLFWV